MSQANNLQRFVAAQETSYSVALAEIKKGKKQSHWMWYIFPQIQGLGFSSTSQYYALKGAQEAQEYLQHALLGNRLIAICEELLALKSHDANQIFGSPDDIKLRSSMTLFAAVPQANSIFQLVLDKFFEGKQDQKTLQLLSQHS